MKNLNYLLLAIVIFSTFFFNVKSFSQPWYDNLSPSQKENFYKIQKSFENYWIGKDYTQKANGWKQFKRWEWFWEQRVYPTGEFPNPMQLYKESKIINDKKRGDKLLDEDWNFLGPQESAGGYAGLGRINCVVTDPNNSSIIWAGSASGGLWKSTNGGTNWSTNTDELSVLGVSDLIINPDNTSIMYMATGDRDHSDTYSIGVLKSTNGGVDWSTTGLNWEVTQTRTISRLLIHPTDRNILYAAASNGIYKTTDAGNTWTQIHTGNYKDMEFKPNDPSYIYASGTQFHTSTNGGSTWEQITAGLPTSNVQRIALGVTPASPGYVYALISKNGSSFMGLYRSTNRGQNWTEMSTQPNILGWQPDGSDNGGQGWYDLCIAVSPLNSDLIFAGGINVWKSTNGGASWTINTMWYDSGSIPTIHADQHDLVYLPSSSTLFAGNDGGVYRSTNNGDDWEWIGSGLKITQFYRMANAPTNSNIYIAGAQDNGTKLKTTSEWKDVIGGDGMECLVDHSNSDIIYGELYYGQIRRSTDGGNSWVSIKNNITETGGWVTPYIIDPIDPAILYSGFNNVWKTTNRGNAWTAISDFGDSRKLSILAICKEDPDVIYAGTGLRLHRTTNGGTSWTEVSKPSSRTMTYLTVHSSDPMKIWASFSGYTSGEKVYYSDDGGVNWDNISGSIPNVPVNSIIYQNYSPQRIFIGTDIGVFYTDSTLSDWQDYNSNLPNVVITELDIHECSNKLRAATYGRGVWETEIMNALPNPDLSYPEDNTSGISIDGVTLDWQEIYKATKYSLQVSDNSAFTNLIVNINNVTSTEYLLENLASDTEYFWRVKAEGTCLFGDWSAPYSFTTSGNPPILYYPQNNAKGIAVSTRFVWHITEGVLNYRIHIATDSLFNNIVVNQGNLNDTILIANLEYSTKYFWRVNGIGSGWSTGWSEVWKFETILDRPEIISPADNSKNNPVDGIISWTTPMGAEKYHLQISLNNSFTSIIIDTSDLSFDAFDYYNLDYNTDYYIRVRASNISGTSEWSDTTVFKTLLPIPICYEPVFDFDKAGMSGYCKWYEVSGASGYSIQIATDNTFDNIVLDSSGIVAFESRYYGLKPNTLYFWRVKASDQFGESAWSLINRFTTILPGPILEFPPNNATDMDISILFIWNKILNSTEYTLQISEKSSFSSIFRELKVPGDSTVEYNGFNFNKKYYWRVKASSDDFESEWSEVWAFSTKFEKPFLVSPEDEEIRVGLNGFLQWSELDGADSYHLQFSKDDKFINSIIDEQSIFVNTYEYHGLDVRMDYWWRVRAKSDDDYTDWSDVFTFKTDQPGMILNKPDNLAKGLSVNTEFSWHSIKQIQSYNLQVSEDFDFTEIKLDATDLSDTLFVFEGLEPFKQYFWRVREKTWDTWGKWSEIRRFNTLLSSPMLISPENGTIELEENIEFTWSMVNGADNYNLQLSKDADFSSILVDEILTSTSKNIDMVELSSTYYWRVLAIDEDANRNQSEIWSFSTKLPNTVSNNNVGAIEIFPNPAEEYFTLKIDSKSSFDAKMNIYNSMGINFGSNTNRIEFGNNEFIFDTTEMVSGVYYLIIENNEYSEIIRFTVIK